MATQPKLLTSIKLNRLFKDIKDLDFIFSTKSENLIEINEGDIIYAIGDSADDIFLILNGNIKLKYRDPIEGKKILHKSENEFFGEIEILQTTTRNSSAVAESKCLLYKLKRQELNKLIEKNRIIYNNLQSIENKEINIEPSINNSSEIKYQEFPSSIEFEEEIQQKEFSTDEDQSTEKEEIFPNEKEISEKENINTNDEIINEEESFASNENIYSDLSYNLEETTNKDLDEAKIGDKEKIDNWDFSLNDDSFIIETKKSESEKNKKTYEEKIAFESEEKKLTSKEGSKFTNQQLQLIINAAEKVNSDINLNEVLKNIVDAAVSLTNAERGTLYIVDRENGELWSKVISGDNIEEIRLKIGQGLAGWSVQSGKSVHIKDAKTDPRFDPDIDKISGYQTKSMLCYPIKNREGIIVGVIQLLNSKNVMFAEQDENFLEALSIHAALALENASLVQQLLRTDRLISIGKVATFIISDIKKPILTIKHFAEHIKNKNVTEDIKTILNMIVEQANTLQEMIQTTLAYSEGKAISQMKIQNLNFVLDELLEQLAEYVESRNVLLYKKLGKDIKLNLDKKELFQAMYQIMKNACDAMPEGGKIFVTTEIENEFVKIKIKDNGLGIPESIKEKIFEPFMSQGKKIGVGLGLSISEKIIQEHNGKIEVESDLGEGATFSISLPIISEN
ncbi:MAG: hypothetical protein STSR0008_08920 [Ignavibacterium sp.]